jgi:hypothetical protein
MSPYGKAKSGRCPILAERLVDYCLQLGQARFQVLAQMDAQGPATALHQYLEISTRLCRFNDSECVFLSGHRKVRSIVARDL